MNPKLPYFTSIFAKATRNWEEESYLESQDAHLKNPIKDDPFEWQNALKKSTELAQAKIQSKLPMLMQIPKENRKTVIRSWVEEEVNMDMNNKGYVGPTQMFTKNQTWLDALRGPDLT